LLAGNYGLGDDASLKMRDLLGVFDSIEGLELSRRELEAELSSQA
jgi:hypothetical protein